MGLEAVEFYVPFAIWALSLYPRYVVITLLLLVFFELNAVVYELFGLKPPVLPPLDLLLFVKLVTPDLPSDYL